ncbi:hypothetical protein JTB14_029501 [Gonioctena quinquepunctata]|nr:hypothetical protein JTB14_029501 [Gonioctena quinquepunctata]
MKLLLAAFLIGIVSAARLPNTYLPPGAKGVGGGQGLTTPVRPVGGVGGGGNGGGSGLGKFGENGGGGGVGNGKTGGNEESDGNVGNGDVDIPIISYENVNNGDGSYQWSYESGNGIKAREEGELKPGGEEGIQSAVGSYSYTAPDGTEIKVEYTADENGFVPILRLVETEKGDKTAMEMEEERVQHMVVETGINTRIESETGLLNP